MTFKPRFFVIIAVIIAVLAYFIWKHSGGKMPFGPQSTTAAGSGAVGEAGEGSNPSPQQAQQGDILVSTTATKQKWLQAEIDKFNSQSDVKASLDVRESRTAMHDILDGKLQPTVWSPSSPVWVSRLSVAYPEQNNGKAALDMGDPDAYRVIFRSPLVFLTTRDKAAFLTPLLTSGTPFSQLAEYASGEKRAPWGKLKFGYADPLNASSGTLTMSLIISEYAQRHNLSDAD